MSDTDFLKKVQPSGGYIAIVGINPADKDDVQQRFVENDEEAEREIARLKRMGWHTYYGVAKYVGFEKREAKNVQGLQAFWLDIDCTPGKGYDSKADGRAALDAFVALLELPTPITVDSGNGIHAYWLLTEEVPPGVWRPVCDAFKARCQAEGFHVDPSVMEEARIMRVPGTLNHKSDPPLPVMELVTDTTPLSLAEFAEKIGNVTLVPSKPSIFGKSGRGPSKLGKALAEGSASYAPADFGKVATACQHIAACVANRASLSEPLWRAALSIAIRCTDPEPAVVAVSQDYPDYDFEDAMAKALATKGPYTCQQFDGLTEPGSPGCEGCPFRTKHADGTVSYKYTSPIRTGEIQFMGGPTARTQPLPDTSELPDYPPGYYRPDNGGVAKFSKDPEERDQLIYEDDLYISQRLYSANSETEAFVLKFHLPHDPMREFSFSSGMLGDRNLKKLLYEKGLCFGSEANFVLVKNYLDAFVKHLQRKGSATPVYEQFGWANDDSKFILGNQEISKTGVSYSPPSPMTNSIADAMSVCGTLEKWKEIIALYGVPGMERHAFAFLTGFGSPIFKFLGQSGAVIHLISPDSGTGKTTTLQMVNSIYGHPKKLLSTPDDTYNARIAKLGIMNNLPFCADEMTNLPPEEISRLLYSMTQGRGKDRMLSSSNVLRENNTTWQTISLCSSNASFASKLQSIKNNPDGELMRLLEYDIHKKDVPVSELSKELIDIALPENYGWAGRIFIKYLVDNQADAANAVRSMQAGLIKKLNVEQHERFWVSTVAANLTGGFIAARSLSLLDWDLSHLTRIREWAIGNFLGMRQERKAALTDAEGIFGSFMNLHNATIVVANGATAPAGARPMVLMEPKGELVVRFEPDTKELFIVKKNFVDFCVKNGADPRLTVKELAAKNILLDDNYQKRMTKNVPVDTSLNVRTLRLDCTHPAFQSMPFINATGT